MITKNLSLRHDFDESEINEIARLLTDCIGHQTKVEIEKSSANKKFNAEIKYWQKQIQDKATLIEDGFEYRDCSCEVLFNNRIAGQKTIKRLDTGESWVEQMTIDEFDLFTGQNVATDFNSEEFSEVEVIDLPVVKALSPRSPFADDKEEE
jgi:hypothetical protein